MNNIVSNPPRAWQYLLAIALPAIVMVASLGIISHKFYQETQSTQIELEGLAHLTPLFDMSMTLQNIRGITQLQRYGEKTFNSELETLNKQLNDQITALRSAPRSISLGIDDDLKQLGLQTKYTLDAAEINTPQEVFLSHSALVTHSMEIIKHAAESSMLAFDNDPEIYFLAQLIIQQVSGLTESLGRVRGIGSGLILNVRLSNNRQLIQEIHTLRNHLNTAHKDVTRVFTKNSKAEKRIVSLMSRLFKTGDSFITQSEQLMNGQRVSVNSQEFFLQGSRAIDESMLLYEEAKGLLHNRLQIRLSQAQQTIHYAMGGTIITILVMAFFVFSFYRKNNTALLELQDSIASLYDSEAKNRAIINGAVDGILTINEHGIILSANPAAEKLFGYSATEMIGNNVDMLMPEPHQSNHDSYLRRYLGTGRRKVIGIGREAEGMKKDGSLFPLKLSISEAPHRGKRIFTGTIHDISDRKQNEVELGRYKTQLETLVVEKTAELNALHDELKQFAYIASHDLVTQLPAIKESAEALRLLLESAVMKSAADNNSTPFDNNVKKPMVEISEQITAIVQISSRLEWEVNTLIKLSSAGLQALHIETVDMNMLTNNIKTSIETAIDNCTINIRVGELPVVTTDRVAIEQIMKCLLDNAITQLSDDRPGIIEIDTETHNNQFYFYIRDNGKGIAPNELANIFDPFRIKNSASSSCDNIGLTHAMYLARRLGGSLNCQSTLNEGSLFSFSLPAHSSHSSIITQNGENPPDLASPAEHTIASKACAR